MKMPEMDGPAFYRELRHRHPDLSSRFVFISGDTLGGETAAFLDEIGGPSLNKPFAAGEVRSLVRRVLQA